MQINTTNQRRCALWCDIVINVAILIIFYLLGLLILPFTMEEGLPRTMYKVYTIVTPGSFSLIVWFFLRLLTLVLLRRSISMKIFKIAYFKKGKMASALNILKYEIGNFLFIGSLVMFNQANNVNICCGMLNDWQVLGMVTIFISSILIFFFGVRKKINLIVNFDQISQIPTRAK